MHKLYLLHSPEIGAYGTRAFLIRFCDHEGDQAEQCALIAQNVGKCVIKTGTLTEVMEVYNILQDIGLNVEMEEVKI